MHIVKADGTRFTPDELADFLRNSTDYNWGPIRLLTCHNGFCDICLAQQLADILGVNVKAAPGWLPASQRDFHKISGTLFNSDGSLIPVPNFEEVLDWFTFKPSKE